MAKYPNTPGPIVDVLAKRWNIETDTFEFRRFTNVQHYRDPRNLNGRWDGVDEGYRVVAWMPLPEIPKEWPPS